MEILKKFLHNEVIHMDNIEKEFKTKYGYAIDMESFDNAVDVLRGKFVSKEDELERINVLRKQVNDLHVEGKPDVFKPGFNEELQNYVYYIFKDPEQKIVVADKDGEICGFAILHHIYKPENPFMKVRDFLDIDEFCVDEKHRREGIATDMVEFIKNFAIDQGYHRLELNMWEFNQDALAFYEAAGFETFRRYMEMFI